MGIARSNKMDFGQMLVKIAHSYAIAELEKEAFEPFLQDLILGKSDNLSDFVGGTGIDKSGDCKHYLHGLGICHYCGKNVEYMVVKIQLFALIGMPVYEVVVGKKNI